MYIYKFRLLYDEVEGFVRDFEIGAKQTFKDFHEVILNSIKGLNPQELASFYICDRKWNKLKEITLVDMESEVEAFSNEADEADEAQDQYLVTEKTTMENAVLCQYINDPHQRIIYEQDFLHLHTFYIELIKSLEGKEGQTYPVCTHSSGEIPKPVNIKEEAGFQNFLDENEDDEDELFYDDEDLEGLSTDLDETMDLL